MITQARLHELLSYDPEMWFSLSDLAAAGANGQRRGSAGDGGDEATRLQHLAHQFRKSVGLIWCDGTRIDDQVGYASTAAAGHQVDADGHVACAGVGGRELVDDGLAVDGRVLRGLDVLGLLGRDQGFY